MAPEVGQEYETEHEETPPLGQLLLQKGCITPQQLQAALAFQEKSGGKLGEILIALDFIKPRDLFNVLAEQLHFHRADVTEPVGVEHPLPAPLARRFNAIAIEEHGDTLRVAVSEPLSEEERSILSSYTSKQIEQVLATPYELERLWSQVYKRDLLAESINKLEMEQPQNSATRVLTRNQVMIFCLLVLGSILACCVSGKHYLFIVNVVCQSLYFFLAVFKAMIIYRGMNTTTHEVRPADISKLDEDKLPIYTILVPLFREANVLADLVRHIEALDYPKHKLDVRLLLEEDDTETIERAKQLKIPYYFTFVLVPNSHPRTKPKACNYGLIRARGDYVVIYDAEDRPEPDQLKKVLLTFQQAGPSVVCVQAKLNYFNGNQNLLTRWFTQEYSNWFGLLLPGVMALNIPVPLGGTSNHFRMSALKELNAWDPYNVTEDADLGVRLYKFGYQTAIVDSTTWEEANSQVRNWIRQRTRWIKGYIQTWLVHMRHPVQLYRDIGGRGFWGFQAMILGTPLLPLMNPPFWAMMVLWYAQHQQWIPALFPGAIYYVAASLLVLGNFVFVYSGVVGTYAFAHRYATSNPGLLSFRLVWSAVLAPVYWALMSIAAYRAVWQLVANPFYWEKPNTDWFPPNSRTQRMKEFPCHDATRDANT